MIGVLAIGFMQATTGFTALNQIKLVNERADHLDNLQKLLLDMETATRGYLLTFDVNFLRPYYEAIPRVAKLLKTIEQDYAREDEDHAQVAMLVNDAQGVADSLGITLRQAPRVLPNRHAWLDHDKLVMDAYRQQHNKLKDMLLADSQRYTSTSVRNFRYARFATVLLAISGALLLLLAMKLNQKQQMLRDRITRMLHTENDRLEREVRHRTEELASLATYLTNVREEEKLHLARELHDEMGALLTAAKLDANWLERKLGADPQIAERLARLQQTLTTGVTLKRRITNDLRPALLYDLGLIDALRLLA
ncbi:MAG: CHASE3 domain-containing protein, partial [Thiobacillaceae bacterium]